MNYAEALKIVESEFETRYVAPNCQAIRINLTYDGYNGFYIAVCDSEGEAFLSDEGITKDVLQSYGRNGMESALRSERLFVQSFLAYRKKIYRPFRRV